MSKIKLLQGDCIEQMKTLADNSVDSIVTDPPYELGFMGKKWDNTGIAYNKDMWAEALRVLKPGGHLLAFSGTRTYHRMAVAIEDAGFSIRDMVEWVYGSGFPKSLSVGKAVDKLQGNEREIVGEKRTPDGKTWSERRPSGDITGYAGNGENKKENTQGIETKGNSEWEGWGTALKPSHEPICMARKPLEKGLTIAENVLKYRTGGINIDESRVRTTENLNGGAYAKNGNRSVSNSLAKGGGMNQSGKTVCKDFEQPTGRFPANLIHDNSEEVRACFPETKSGGTRGDGVNNSELSWKNTSKNIIANNHIEASSGNASRFFKSIIYQAKASKKERNKGLDSYLTVKYNIPKMGGVLCKEESMVAVQLLKKVMSESTAHFNIGECGVNIMGQCHRDSLSTTLMEINKIIESKILNLLTHSLTSESIADVNCETENGGNLAESVANLRRCLLTTTKGNLELALGASHVVLEMLSLISEEENWKQATNFHSTVKPVALMEYLINMVTPKNGTILDPFAGSGTAGVACKNLNRNFIGIELDPEYFKMAEKRINEWGNLLMKKNVCDEFFEEFDCKPEEVLNNNEDWKKEWKDMPELEPRVHQNRFYVDKTTDIQKYFGEDDEA